MDGLIALALAKGYTNEQINSLGKVIQFKGMVDSYNELPATGNKVGDLWGVREKNAEYIWVKDGESERWELFGDIRSTNKAFPSEWVVNSTRLAFCQQVAADPTIMIGDVYVGGVAFTDLPDSLSNGEAAVTIFDSTLGGVMVHIDLYSATTSPYYWSCNYYNNSCTPWTKQLSVSVSSTGTSTNDVRYITIDGTESRFSAVALKAMKSNWKASTLTTAQAATAIVNDESVFEGDGFLGTVYWSDLPLPQGPGHQAEVKAFVLKKDASHRIVQFECTSGTVSPYAWFFNSYEGVWRGYVPVNDTLTSTSTTEALSANQGKELKTLIDNVKTYQTFPSDFVTGNNGETLQQMINSITGSTGAKAGRAYLGSIYNACSPEPSIFGNLEAKVEYMTNNVAVITAYSSNIAPYHWELNTAQGVWRKWSNITPNPTGTATQTLNKIEISGTVYSIEGGGSGGTVDTALSPTSENPVQNKVVTDAIGYKASNQYVNQRFDEVWEEVDNKLDADKVGVANGVASLAADGKVPTTQLPELGHDNVLEYASVSAFPATGTENTIYIAKDTNKMYRWGGTTYILMTADALSAAEITEIANQANLGTQTCKILHPVILTTLLTFNAPMNMKWSTFVASALNTYGFVIDDEGYVTYNSGMRFAYHETSDEENCIMGIENISMCTYYKLFTE